MRHQQSEFAKSSGYCTKLVFLVCFLDFHLSRLNFLHQITINNTYSFLSSSSHFLPPYFYQTLSLCFLCSTYLHLFLSPIRLICLRLLCNSEMNAIGVSHCHPLHVSVVKSLKSVMPSESRGCLIMAIGRNYQHGFHVSLAVSNRLNGWFVR